MTIVLSVSVLLTAALAFLLLGSQIEMYRSIEQLREYGGLVDRPRPVDLPPVGERPSSVGLPAELDSAAAAVVLLLSDKCATCRSIAESLDGVVPDDVLLVIAAEDPSADSALEMTYDLDPARTLIDSERRIPEALGITTTPVAVVVEQGRFSRATTVPSTRQLHALRKSLRSADTLAIGGTSTRKGSDRI